MDTGTEIARKLRRAFGREHDVNRLADLRRDVHPDRLIRVARRDQRRAGDSENESLHDDGIENEWRPEPYSAPVSIQTTRWSGTAGGGHTRIGQDLHVRNREEQAVDTLGRLESADVNPLADVF